MSKEQKIKRDDLVSVLTYKLNKIVEINNLFEEYMKVLEYIRFIFTDPQEVIDIKSNIIQIKDKQEKAIKYIRFVNESDIPGLTLSDKFKIHFKGYNYLKKFDDYLESTFNTYLRFEIVRVSDNYSLGNLKKMNMHLSEIKLKYKDYQKIKKNGIEMLGKFILQDINIEEIDVEIVFDLYMKYRNIDFTVMIYQYILNVSNDKEKIHKILHYTEKIKNDVLKNSLDWEDKNFRYSDDEKNKKTNIIQHLVQMYSLVPTSISKPLSEIISELFPELKQNKDMSIKNLNEVLSLVNKHKTYGFIIFNKVFNTKLEYLYWNLLDHDYLKKNNLIYSRNSGINDKTLKRTTTIKELENNKYNETEMIVKIYPKKEVPEHIIVLETLDGHNYRILTQWFSKNNRATSISIPSQRLNGIEDQTPSLKIYQYNTLLENEIFKMVSLINYREDIEIDTFMIRSSIVSSCMDFIKKSDIPKNEKEILELINSDGLEKSLHKQIVKYIKNNIFKKDMNPKYNHLLLSYTSKIDEKASQFKKELQDTYFKMPLKFKDYKNENEFKIVFIQKMNDDIEHSVEYIIPDNTNIFIELREFKNKFIKI